MIKMNKIEKLKAEKDTLKKEVKQRTLGYITAAFGLVAGLAWNEAIKASIEYLFPLSHNGLLAKFIYAMLMTLAVVLIAIYLVKLLKIDDN